MKKNDSIFLKFDKEKEKFTMDKRENFEIFITDLKEDVQKELIEFLGGENGNYDVMPLVTIFNESDED